MRCRHCHILFFTDPRNAGRSDLGCPFGCRQAHRRKNAIHRSTEYYKSEEGKVKKKLLNAERRQRNGLAKSSEDGNCNNDSGSKIDDVTVCHIQVVTSLIEGRDVGLAEIKLLLDKILRQHSIDIGSKLPYVRFCSQKDPP